MSQAGKWGGAGGPGREGGGRAWRTWSPPRTAPLEGGEGELHSSSHSATRRRGGGTAHTSRKSIPCRRGGGTAVIHIQRHRQARRRNCSHPGTASLAGGEGVLQSSRHSATGRRRGGTAVIQAQRHWQAGRTALVKSQRHQQPGRRNCTHPVTAPLGGWEGVLHPSRHRATTRRGGVTAVIQEERPL